jgi:RNA polymerase sigma-70 factor (ECF subfamily)
MTNQSTTRHDERLLIQQLVTRDRDAWVRFVQNYQGLVYSRVTRTAQECNRVLDRADVEDICAEVFACLVANEYASLRRFEGRSSLATWLSVITRRIALRSLIKPRPDAAAGESDGREQPKEPQTQRDSALAQLIRAEDAARLNKMLDRLNPPDQRVLRMFYVEHLGYAEISKRMEISINTVGPKLHRAHQRLKRLLEERGNTSRSGKTR